MPFLAFQQSGVVLLSVSAMPMPFVIHQWVPPEMVAEASALEALARPKGRARLQRREGVAGPSEEPSWLVDAAVVLGTNTCASCSSSDAVCSADGDAPNWLLDAERDLFGASKKLPLSRQPLQPCLGANRKKQERRKQRRGDKG